MLEKATSWPLPYYYVRVSNTTFNTDAPQGCAISPLQFMLLTHNCAIKSLLMFGTTVVGLISNNDKSAYREMVEPMADKLQSVP